MTLRELIEAKGNEKFSSYEDYYKSMMKKFNLPEKSPIFKLSKEQKKELDAGWTSKKEKK